MNHSLLILKKILYYNFDLFHLRGERAIRKVREVTQNTSKDFPDSKLKIGITKEGWHLHSHYIQACYDLHISYEVIDMFSKDWYEQILKSHIDFLVGRPSVQYGPWKEMFDNRLKLLHDLNLFPIYPNIESLWIWESKLRTLEWLKLNKIPHPDSYIFYNLNEVRRFGEECEYPIVYKSSSGSGASGVKILRNYTHLVKVVKTVFNKGIRSYRKHNLDKEHGFVILQSFLPEVREWRIIRIGKFYFGYEKLKEGDFHSGSQQFGYGMPPLKCLDFVRSITDKHHFLFVDIDIFLSKDGQLLVNEIQPYFGQKDDRELLKVNDVSGSMIFDEGLNQWNFEAGQFCINNLCNLRLQEMIKLNEKMELKNK